MDSSVSPKDEIRFLRVCHHISNAVYQWWSCNVVRIAPFGSFGWTLCDGFSPLHYVWIFRFGRIAYQDSSSWLLCVLTVKFVVVSCTSFLTFFKIGRKLCLTFCCKILLLCEEFLCEFRVSILHGVSIKKTDLSGIQKKKVAEGTFRGNY